MTDLAKLLTDCDARGIRLLPVGEDGLTIDAPKDALIPELMGRLKAHKGELLAILRSEADTRAIDLTDAKAVWQAALDSLDGNPLFPSDTIAALRVAEVRWENDTNDAPEPRTATREESSRTW